MTRKDYVALASALAYTRPERTDGSETPVSETAWIYWMSQWETDVESIVMALKADNSRFDAERFWQACRA